jgi:DNA-binding helix-hairpin-helix protein with protein kinase domain
MPLGELVGRGGEGEVYAVQGAPALVAKIYTGDRASSREPKVKAMLAAALAESSSLISYPSALVLDQRGRFAGFLMRRVDKAKPLHQLYKPISRKKHFAEVDYRFLVHVAINVAKAIASVHRTGCVVGDVNESGVLVTGAGKVALIDADSFQIEHGGRRFGCEVGKPEYTAPELQNRSLKDMVRSTSHDDFALAVMLFQLLWMGRHPFSGTFRSGEMPLERAIGEHRFAYSSHRDVGMTPPPNVYGLDLFPPYVGSAFEDAFAKGVTRPSAERWVTILEQVPADLLQCVADRLHHYPSTARECPWCRMRLETGVEMFVPPPLAVGEAPPEADWSGAFDIIEIWRAIDRVAQPPAPTEPMIRIADAQPSSKAIATKRGRIERKLVGVLWIAAAIGVVAFLPGAWPVWAALGLFGLAKLFGDGDEGAFTRAFEEADRHWVDGVVRWRGAALVDRFGVAKEQLAAARKSYEALAGEQKRRLDEAQRDRRERQLKAWLEQFQIRRFRIKGLASGRVATLASYGIETAAEVEAARLLRVPGFGAVSSQPLLDWRKRLEARFAYDPRPGPVDAQRVASIRADVTGKAIRLKAELTAGPARLAKVAAEIMATRLAPTPELEALWFARSQAEVDLQHLGRPIPVARAIPAASPSSARAAAPPPLRNRTAVPAGAKPQIAAASGSKVCPNCGSVMVKRTARKGRNAGGQFWGCSKYPGCKGTRPT